MTSVQVVLSVVSVLISIAVYYSTWSFNHWSRKRDTPDPVLAREVLFETKILDGTQVSITASLSFLNPGLASIFVQRIGIGLRGARGGFHKAWAAPEEIPPGKIRQFNACGTWPRSAVCTEREAIIHTAFVVGCRAGELLISGLEVPRVSTEPSGEPLSEGTKVLSVKFPGRPTPARYPVRSFTFSATFRGRAYYWLLRTLRRSPIHRFNRWCSASPHRRQVS